MRACVHAGGWHGCDEQDTNDEESADEGSDEDERRVMRDDVPHGAAWTWVKMVRAHTLRRSVGGTRRGMGATVGRGHGRRVDGRYKCGSAYSGGCMYTLRRCDIMWCWMDRGG